MKVKGEKVNEEKAEQLLLFFFLPQERLFPNESIKLTEMITKHWEADLFIGFQF